MRRTPLKAASGLAALLAASVSAQAADLPARAPVYTKAPPPAVYDWSGFYVGGGGGYGMWNADTNALVDPSFVAPPGFPFGPGAVLTQTTTNGGRGWFGTVTAGFDYQFSAPIVAGVFADYDFASIKGTLNTGLATNFFNPLGGSEKESSAWAVGGRVGWLLTPAILTYFNGGYTQARFDGFAVANLTGILAGAPAPTGFFTNANTYRGWFIGTGLETQLAGLFGIFGKGWFMRTEYRYADYRSATLPVLSPTTPGGIALVGGIPVDVSVHPIVQTVRTELTYKFNWWGH